VVKKLRVVALQFRAAGIDSNRNRGPAGAALISTPVSTENGTWDVKVVLGETPVHEDGSAHFEVPARMPLYFQLIDGDGHIVQSMRSWSTLQPGETRSCLGCHEDKNATGPTAYGSTIAMQSKAKPLMDFHGPPRGFSFRKEIQPILDKHCVRCHDDRTKTGPTGNMAADKKAFSLLSTADKPRDGRLFSDAYLNLTLGQEPNRMVNWLNVQSIPPMLPPYFAGSAKSELMTLLREKHFDVNLSRAELETVACWIDLLVPYCGDYMEANAWSESDKAKYTYFQEKREAMEKLERENIEALITSPFRWHGYGVNILHHSGRHGG
jgi:hypothetical protein